MAQGLNNPSLRLMVEEKGFTIARSMASYTRELKIKSGCLSAKSLDDPSVYECPRPPSRVAGLVDPENRRKPGDDSQKILYSKHSELS